MVIFSLKERTDRSLLTVKSGNNDVINILMDLLAPFLRAKLSLNKLSIDKVDLKGKRVLIRVDVNVPQKDGKITNNQLIAASIPTLKYAIEREA
uniref:Phosphoglycerate kinase n=1 Tax=Panagrolaimus sp. ES5 TaxID=591445 RepID=A0AC34FHH7_9BILA